MNTTYRKYLPYVVAVVLFAVLTLIYFKPLLSGKELQQGDISRHKAMSQEIVDFREKHNAEPLWTNSMFGGMPAYQISTLYPGNFLSKLDPAFKLFLPHPGGYMFLYFLGFYILLLCLRTDPWLSLVGALAYGLSSYFLIIIEAGHNSKANALGYLPALIGGVILLFSGRRWLGFALTTLFTAMELNTNHVQITYYGYMLIAFILLGYFITAFREKLFAGFGKALLLFILATVLGVLPNAGNILTTFEYTKYSTRGRSELSAKAQLKMEAREKGISEQEMATDPEIVEKLEKNKTSGLDADYATQWSYGIGETFTFLIPDFKGGASGSIQQSDPDALKKVRPDFRQEVAYSNAYFGDQPGTSGPVYIGAIVVFLAFLAMLIVKHPLKWPLFFATVLTIALGWGHNFMALTEFFLHNVPGYNKFRAVSMIMVVAEITLPLLAVLAVNELLKHKTWQDKITLRLLKRTISLRNAIFISLAFVGGFCLLGYLAPNLVNEFTSTNEAEIMVAQYVQAGYPEEQVRPHVADLMPELESARQQIFRSDAGRSLIFVGLAFAMIFLFYSGKIDFRLFLGMLGLFIVIDLWTVDMRYLNERSFVSAVQNVQAIAEKTAADEEILRDTTLHYRVLDLSRDRWQDAVTSYYHKSIGGYHGAKLKKYQELIEFHLDNEVNRFYREANTAMRTDSGRLALLEGMQLMNMLNARYFILPAGEDSEELPLLNEMANGNAWLVKHLKIVPDADAEILELAGLDTRETAVVQARFAETAGLKAEYEASGTIRLIAYEPNQLTYTANLSAPGFAVFSEIYYPEGWNAYVNGQLHPHVGVNYVLRGMELPAGQHTIEFRFEPASYRTGNTIAAIGSALVLLVFAGGVYLHRRNRVIVS